MGILYDVNVENKVMIKGFASRFPFYRHPAFRYKTYLEGYKNYIFGAVAGDVGIDNLCHEIAHAAEFGPENFTERAKKYGYRFKWVEQECDDPVTAQSTQRECRTFGMEIKLMEIIEAPFDEKDFLDSAVSALNYMQDSEASWGGMKRAEAIKKLILDTRESWTHQEIIDRVEGWLDKTQWKLNLEKECGIN